MSNSAQFSDAILRNSLTPIRPLCRSVVIAVLGGLPLDWICLAPAPEAAAALRLLRMLYWWHLHEGLVGLEALEHVHVGVTRITLIVVWIVLVIHLLATLWFYVGGACTCRPPAPLARPARRRRAPPARSRPQATSKTFPKRASGPLRPSC